MTAADVSLPTPWFADPGNFARARDAFLRAGYTDDAIRTTLGKGFSLSARDADPIPLLDRTGDGTPLHDLIRLFLLGVELDRSAAERALAPMPLDAWEQAGLLTVRSDQVLPRQRVFPFRGLLLVSDLHHGIHTGDHPDVVLGPGNAAVLTASAAIRRPSRQSLDLGTGCGVLALLASSHSEHVVATDKNPRAAGYTRFNAALNDIDNVECLTGDLFEPVAGRRFDLVVCNPPYVIAPASRYVFRDSGFRGDEFCREIVRQIPDRLEAGGYGQMLCNWPHRASESWQDGLAGWFDGLGCDVLVLGGETQEASDYAINWIRGTEPGGPESFPQHYERWMRFFEAEGIEAVSYGVITLRRSGGPSQRVLFEDFPKQAGGHFGDDVARRFDRLDYLDSLPDDRQLLNGRFRLSPNLRLVQHYAPGDEGLHVVETRLRLVHGLESDMESDPNVTELLLRFQRERTLREVLEEMAAARQIPLDDLAAGGATVLRRLIDRGYVLPQQLADAGVPPFV